MPRFNWPKWSMRSAISLIVFGTLATIALDPAGITPEVDESSIITGFIAWGGIIIQQLFSQEG